MLGLQQLENGAACSHYFSSASGLDRFSLVSRTLIFLAFGAVRAFSVLLFLFLDLVLRTRLTVRVMLVGVCCVAVYSTVEGESSSSQLSVALLSPPTKKSQ